eukprot:jgi/Bigna1/134442/aug1.25_g9150
MRPCDQRRRKPGKLEDIEADLRTRVCVHSINDELDSLHDKHHRHFSHSAPANATKRPQDHANDLDVNGTTVLVWASFHNRLFVAQVVPMEGAHIDAKDQTRKTAVDWAKERGAEVLALHLRSTSVRMGASKHARTRPRLARLDDASWKPIAFNGQNLHGFCWMTARGCGFAGNKVSCQVEGRGTVAVKTENGGVLKVQNVAHVPEFPNVHLSPRQLRKQEHTIEALRGGDGWQVDPDKPEGAIASNEVAAASKSFRSESRTMAFCHKAPNHVSGAAMKRTASATEGTKTKDDDEEQHCESCDVAKTSKRVFSKTLANGRRRS